MLTEHLLQRTSWLRELARMLLMDEGAAEDVVQDTWVRVLETRSLPVGAESSWLARVTRNLAINRRRSHVRRVAREERVARTELVESADVSAQRLETQRVLVNCLLALPECYREVLVLRYFDELSPVDIARRLQVPRPTIHTRIRRGLVQLRVLLEARLGKEPSWRSGLSMLLSPVGAAAVPVAMGVGFLGGISMKTVLASLTVAVLGLVTWWGVPADEGNSPTSLSRDESSGPRSSLEADAERSSVAVQRVLVQEPVAGSRVDPEPVVEEDIVVRVVGSDGGPRANVPLSIEGDRPGVDRPVAFWNGVTGDDGAVAAPVRSALEVSYVSDLRVVVRAPLRGPPSVPYPEVVPDEPLTLTLPDGVRLEARVIDHDGFPFAGDVDLAIQVRDVPPPGHQAVFSPYRSADHLERGDDGAWSIANVEVGCLAVLHVTSVEGAFEAFDHSVATDVFAGSTLLTTIQVPKPAGRVIARLIDGEGKALSRLSVQYRLLFAGAAMTPIEGEPFGVRAYDARTNDEGLLILPMPRNLADPTWALFWVRVSGQAHESLRHRTVETRLPKKGDAGDVDLGDLDVTAAPLLAKGKVVDEEDRPVRNALVRLELGATNPQTGKVGFGPHPNYDWTTGADGRFVLYGRDDGHPVRIAVHSDRGGTARREITPPAHDLILRLERPHEVTAEVLADPWVPRNVLLVGLRTKAGQAIFGQRDGEGTYRFRSLAAGRYRVAVRVMDHEVVVLSDVEVTASTDELPTLDARGKIQVVRMELRLPDGSPCAGQQFVQLTNTGYSQYARTEAGGRVDLWHGVDTTHVDVLVPGYRAARCLPGTEVQIVQLQPGYEVELHLKDPPAWIAEKQATLQLLRESDEGKPIGMGVDVTLEGHDIGRCVLSSPGTYRLQWLTATTFGGVKATTIVQEEHPKRVRVLAAGERQVLEVQLGG